MLVNPSESDREDFSNSLLARIVSEASKQSVAELYLLDMPNTGKFVGCGSQIDELR